MATDPSSFNIENVDQYLTAGKSALDLLKGAIGLLPKGTDKEKAQEQIRQAEAALEMSKAGAAKALGYRLCQCTFPPQIMLWNEQGQAHICPNASCGRRDAKPKIIGPSSSTWGRGGGRI